MILLHQRLCQWSFTGLPNALVGLGLRLDLLFLSVHGGQWFHHHPMRVKATSSSCLASFVAPNIDKGIDDPSSNVILL
ncbi:unnamed protein product [Cylicocyclus nassatus]|uniref:Uncharacterized protein n=1 Tax=Cylicocyclus nassatus TaxID=53992 RepID=A0AA36DM07_CYLNA|nr:unnamed protein product [Cylicocyclus nassatus]